MKQIMRVAAMGIAGMMVLSAAAAVPYIESDGTQAINTGYFVNPSTKIEIDFAMRDLVTAQQRMFGCNNTANNDGLVLCQLYVNGSRGYSFALSENPLGSTWWTIRPDSVQIYVTTARRFFVLDAPNKLASLYTDGVLNASRETKTITQTATYPLTLFATCINADCTSFSDQKASMRLYSFKIYENNSLVMELLPYREGTRYGLKDTITGNTFFPHVGNPLTGGNLGEEDPDTVVIDPGYNVTTNGPQVLGAKNVQINTGADAAPTPASSRWTPAAVTRARRASWAARCGRTTCRASAWDRLASARRSCSAPARSVMTDRTAARGAARSRAGPRRRRPPSSTRGTISRWKASGAGRRAAS